MATNSIYNGPPINGQNISANGTSCSSLNSYNVGTTQTVPMPRKDRITFDIDQECKKYDPGMYYMLIAYLYKHIENFEAVVKQDDDFRQYRIKTKVTESSGEFQFTIYYDKDVTRG